MVLETPLKLAAVGSALSLSTSMLLEMFPKRCVLRVGRSLQAGLLLAAQQAGSPLSVPEAMCSPCGV